MEVCPKRGNVTLIFICVFTVVLVVSGFLVLRISQNVAKKTAFLEKAVSGRPLTTTATTSQQYQNPFDATTQASNPFDDYENPFDTVQ